MRAYLKVLAVASLACIPLVAAGQVTTRLVVPGDTATTVKIVPGGVASFEVRVDAPATPTVGASYRLTQSAPPLSGFLQVTGRSIAGSPYTVVNQLDADVTSAPGRILDPANDVDLGNQVPDLAVPAPAAANILVGTITLASGVGTPLGTYRVQPLGGASFVSDGINDYSMSAAFFDIVVGQTLSVTVGGTGAGSVSADSGTIINCTKASSPCSDIYPGTTVILTATPTGGNTFTGWGGDCAASGTATTCTIAVTAARTVSAIFAPAGPGTATLVVTKSGTGTGTVTSNVGSIICGPTCSANIATGTEITLTAVADAGSVFAGWTGGVCSGTATCVLTLNDATTVNAVFNLPDVSPPDTTITVAPPNPSYSTTATFEFTSTEAGSTFECALDGGAFAACSTPITFNVAIGSHTFSVRAIDPAGNVDPTPASYTWTVAVIDVTRGIPTLNEWALILLALVLGGLGMAMQRRRN